MREHLALRILMGHFALRLEDMALGGSQGGARFKIGRSMGLMLRWHVAPVAGASQRPVLAPRGTEPHRTRGRAVTGKLALGINTTQRALRLEATDPAGTTWRGARFRLGRSMGSTLRWHAALAAGA